MNTTFRIISATKITYNQSQRHLDNPHHPIPTNSGQPLDITPVVCSTWDNLHSHNRI